MSYYIITETVQYEVEADSEDDALELFVQADDINQYLTGVTDRYVEPAPLYYCRGCGREESACSLDPCPGVIADRES